MCSALLVPLPSDERDPTPHRFVWLKTVVRYRVYGYSYKIVQYNRLELSDNSIIIERRPSLSASAAPDTVYYVNCALDIIIIIYNTRVELVVTVKTANG